MIEARGFWLQGENSNRIIKKAQVVSFNRILASQAVTEVLQMLTGFRGVGLRQLDLKVSGTPTYRGGACGFSIPWQSHFFGFFHAAPGKRASKRVETVSAARSLSQV